MLNELTTKNTLKFSRDNIFPLSRGLKTSDYASLNNQKAKTDELQKILRESEELTRPSTAR